MNGSKMGTPCVRRVACRHLAVGGACIAVLASISLAFAPASASAKQVRVQVRVVDGLDRQMVDANLLGRCAGWRKRQRDRGQDCDARPAHGHMSTRSP
ncbi:MAG: hypothetical protein ACKOPI_06225, partial [bacterium]